MNKLVQIIFHYFVAQCLDKKIGKAYINKSIDSSKYGMLQPLPS